MGDILLYTTTNATYAILFFNILNFLIMTKVIFLRFSFDSLKHNRDLYEAINALILVLKKATDTTMLAFIKELIFQFSILIIWVYQCLLLFISDLFFNKFATSKYIFNNQKSDYENSSNWNLY